MELIVVSMVAYSVITTLIVFLACVACINGDLDCHPLAYFFWPLIAFNAVLIKLRDMWR